MEIVEIDVGDDVYCDFCGGDYSGSDAQGGLLFGRKAVCPECMARVERDAKAYDEAHLILARCPEGKSFATWVREELRAPAGEVM